MTFQILSSFSPKQEVDFNPSFYLKFMKISAPDSIGLVRSHHCAVSGGRVVLTGREASFCSFGGAAGSLSPQRPSRGERGERGQGEKRKRTGITSVNRTLSHQKMASSISVKEAADTLSGCYQKMTKESGFLTTISLLSNLWP